MNIELRMWLTWVTVDIIATALLYLLTSGSLFVIVTIVPTIILLVILLPIHRMINEIDRQFDKQNGKCYNCNLKILDKDKAVLEDNNQVYCHDCDEKLFGNTYEQRNGIWYKKSSKTGSQGGNQE